MDHNPYTPPRANTEAESPAPAEVSRPISVWFLLVLFALFGLMFVLSTVRLIAAMSTHSSETDNLVPLLVSLVWNLALVVIFFGAAHGAYRRHRWSRWFGIALVALMAGFAIFGPDTTQYANSAERAGGMVGEVLVLLLLGWWGYALGFSAKVRRYFAQGS